MNKKVLSNIAWMVFDKVFMLALNLLVTVRIANHFGATEYGSYQYAVSIVAILEILVAFVDGRVVKRKYMEYPAEMVVYSASVCRVVFSVIAACVGVLILFVMQYDAQFSAMFFILLVNAIITNLRFGMANRFEFLLKSKRIVLAADCAAIVGAILQLIAVANDLSIVAISIIATISAVFNLVMLKIQYNIEFSGSTKKCNRFDKKLTVEMLKESFPLALATSCATIYVRCDSVMLGAMLSTAEVGIYAISAKLIAVVQIGISPIRESVYPHLLVLYKEDKIKYIKKYIQISSVLTWVYILGVVFSFVVLPQAFQFLNADYQTALPVYKIHVLGSFFMYNAALRAGHFTMIHRGDILVHTQVISMIINIILNVVGIYFWGLYGAALATAITQMLSLWLFNLFFKDDGREVFLWQLKALNPVYIFIR